MEKMNMLLPPRVRAAMELLAVVHSEETAIAACILSGDYGGSDKKTIAERKSQCEGKRKGLLAEIERGLDEDRVMMSKAVVSAIRTGKDRERLGRDVELIVEVKQLVRVKKNVRLPHGQRVLESYLDSVGAERAGAFRFRLVVRALNAEDLETQVWMLICRGDSECRKAGFTLFAEVRDRTGRRWGEIGFLGDEVDRDMVWREACGVAGKVKGVGAAV